MDFDWDFSINFGIFELFVMAGFSQSWQFCCLYVWLEVEIFPVKKGGYTQAMTEIFELIRANNQTRHQKWKMWKIGWRDENWRFWKSLRQWFWTVVAGILFDWKSSIKFWQNVRQTTTSKIVTKWWNGWFLQSNRTRISVNWSPEYPP